VVNESIRYGFLQDVSFVFYPYGELTIETEDELISSLPEYYRSYLIEEKVALARRSKINPNRWWELTRHRNWLEEAKPKIVSTYFGDAGSFAWDSDGDYLIVQGWGWLPLWKTRTKKQTEVIGLAYLAILNSSLFSDLLSATSNHVAGGQWNLSSKYVSEIPLPDLPNLQRIAAACINELSTFGEQIYLGQPISDEKLTKLVRSLYVTES